jgi:hypothetical protein
MCEQIARLATFPTALPTSPTFPRSIHGHLTVSAYQARHDRRAERVCPPPAPSHGREGSTAVTHVTCHCVTAGPLSTAQGLITARSSKLAKRPSGGMLVPGRCHAR